MGATRSTTFLALPRLRAILAVPIFRRVAEASALAYVAVAGATGMVTELPRASSGGFLWIVPRGPGFPWEFPAVLAGDGRWRVVAPILPTLVMVLTAAGVGLGMASVAFVIGRYRAEGRRVADGPGAALGLSPALVAFLLLGACCGATAAAGAGVVAMAAGTGTNATAVSVNPWFVGLFQLAVVMLSLFAQEQLLEIYEGVAPEARPSPARRRPNVRNVVVGAARGILAGAGLLWAFAGLSLWFAIPLGTGSPGQLAVALGEHLVPGGLVVALALFPPAFTRRRRTPDRSGSRTTRSEPAQG